MKKKMINHLLKKSFITIFAVCVLSTSICIAAFAEEDSTLEASEESVVVEEVSNSDIESPQYVESDIIVEYPTSDSTDQDQSNDYIDISDDASLDFDIDNIYADFDNTNNETAFYPEYTITIKYYDVDNDSLIREFSYDTSEFYICVDIPKTLQDGNSTYSYANNIHVRTNEYEFSDDKIIDFFFHEIFGDVDVYIYYSLDPVINNENDVNIKPVDDSYDVTIKYMYSLPSDPYTYLEFAGSEFEKIYNNHLASKTSVKMNYFPSDMYGYGYGTFVNDFAVTDLSSYGFKSYNMFVPFVEGFTEYGEQGTFSALPFLDQLYLTRESENVITIIYNLKEEETSKDTTEDSTETIVPEEPTVDIEIPEEPTVDTEIPTEPTVDTVVPTEPIVDTVVPTEPTVDTAAPTEPTVDTAAPAEPTVDTVVPTEPTVDTVVPTEPTVDTAAPTEKVAPAPAEPVAPAVPALVESAPIVAETGTFPPMVEEVDAPAFVFPTLLKATEEIMELIPDEELPLANIELKKTETPMGHIHMDPHLCNILSLLLLLAVAFVVYSYTQMAKKHEERIYELKLGYRY